MGLPGRDELLLIRGFTGCPAVTDEQELIPTGPRSGYLPQRFPTALVTASRIASWRIAHWN
jgi:hypothetical protein